MSDKALLAITIIMTIAAAGSVAYGMRQAEHVDAARAETTRLQRTLDETKKVLAETEAERKAEIETASVRIQSLKDLMKYDDLTACTKKLSGRIHEVDLLRAIAHDKDTQLKTCLAGGR